MQCKSLVGEEGQESERERERGGGNKIKIEIVGLRITIRHRII
jgi:hypothetical protein